MAVEVIAAAVGMALVAVGIWFYVGNGWSVFRTDFFLTYLFMAIPMGLGFIAMALARSRIAGAASPLLGWGGVALLLIAIILAYTKPAKLAPRWLQKDGYEARAGGARAIRFHWPIWYLLGVTMAVVVLATIIEWEQSHGG
jgi:hypothetical protein